MKEIERDRPTFQRLPTFHCNFCNVEVEHGLKAQWVRFNKSIGQGEQGAGSGLLVS